MAVGPDGKKLVGLAACTPERRREIARKGQAAARAAGKLYKFDHETAVRAGRKAGSLPRVRTQSDPGLFAELEETSVPTEAGWRRKFSHEEAVLAGRKAGSLERLKPGEVAPAPPPARLVDLAERSEVVAVLREQDAAELRAVLAEIVSPETLKAVEAVVEAPPSQPLISAPVQTLIDRISDAETEARRMKRVHDALEAKLREIQAAAAEKRQAEAAAAPTTSVAE
jgi:general stress protein YciG